MKLVRNIALALGLALGSGAVLGGTALAEHGGDRGDRPDYRDDGDQGRGNADDQGRWGNGDDQGRGGDDDDRGDWNQGGDRGGWDQGGEGRHHGHWWRRFVPVSFENRRDQLVTVFDEGRFVGRIAPNSVARFFLPPGVHAVSYQVGYGGRYRELTVSAFRGQRNYVVIEAPRWHHWGGWGGWGSR